MYNNTEARVKCRETLHNPLGTNQSQSVTWSRKHKYQGVLAEYVDGKSSPNELRMSREHRNTSRFEGEGKSEWKSQSFSDEPTQYFHSSYQTQTVTQFNSIKRETFRILSQQSVERESKRHYFSIDNKQVHSVFIKATFSFISKSCDKFNQPFFNHSRRKFSSYRISISYTNGTKNSWIEKHQLLIIWSFIKLRLSRLTCCKCRRRVITIGRRTTITVAAAAVETRKRVLHSCFSRIFCGRRRF